MAAKQWWFKVEGIHRARKFQLHVTATSPWNARAKVLRDYPDAKVTSVFGLGKESDVED